MSQVIDNSIAQLLSYIEQEQYKGYDPYDGLKSPLFKLPFFKSNKFIRFAFQQFVKRVPINLRPLFFIAKGINPVTLGLVIQSYGYLSVLDKSKQKIYIDRARNLINLLENLSAKGFSGICWGYDFDWEARYAKILAYKPTVVATGIITNALYEYYQITKDEKAAFLCVDAANFVINDLNRTEDKVGIAFSYSPFDRQVVFNASMKGGRLLSQVYQLTGHKKYIKLAQQVVDYVIKFQNTDGSWYYGLQKGTKWIDNYHTGYVLDCLDEFIKHSGYEHYKINLKKGVDFYVHSFFEQNTIPKFYHNRMYPIDCTAAGQSLLSLTRFGYWEIAQKVAEYMIQTMQDKKGYFYFRKYKKHLIKTSFMRWSNAWMLVGLTYLKYKIRDL